MRSFLLFAVVCSLLPLPALGDDQKKPIPSQLEEFQLPSINEKTVELKRNGPITIVYFLGTECPLVKLYSARIQKIAGEQKTKVRIIGISSNRQDSLADLKAFVDQHSIEFEVAKDYDNRIADQFHATRTPEVFLLNSQLQVVYRGRVDDQYSPGVSRATPEKHFLRDALDQLQQDQPIDLAVTEPVGCLIGKVRKPNRSSQVTYCNQVSRLLQKHCIECHRTGEIGPFALTDYEEVVGWSDMMLEVVDQKRMPPWHADSKHGDFLNARYLSAKERQLLAEWVENGSPYGDQKRLPPRRKFATGWDLPQEPDQIIEMSSKPYRVPATGVVEYQYRVAYEHEFKEDKWVRAAQVLPGNRSVVHHSIVFVRPPDGSAFKGIGWLSAYVPGQRPVVLPPGTRG